MAVTVAMSYFAFSKPSESVMKMFVNGLVGAVLGGFSTLSNANSNVVPEAVYPPFTVSVAVIVLVLRLQETETRLTVALHDTLAGTTISEGMSNLNLSPDVTYSFVITWNM